MADDPKRGQQFAYKEYASLVLETDRRGLTRGGPTGEATSLSNLAPMGDRAQRVRPKPNQPGRKKPKSTSTPSSDSFHRLLSLVEAKVGAQPYEVLKSAVEEVVEIINDPNSTSRSWGSNIRNALGVNVLDDELVTWGRLCKTIGAEDATTSALDSGAGVSVVIDEDDTGAIEYESEEEEEFEEELNTRSTLRIAEEGQSGSATGGFDVRVIDAFWLQRQLASSFSDAHEAQEKAEHVLALLSSDATERGLENSLAQSLGFDNFTFIKLLLSHRRDIVYCTRLARSSTEERRVIEDEMYADPVLRELLISLRNAGPNDRNDLQAHIDAEARALKHNNRSSMKSSTGGSGWLGSFRPSKTLDLEELKFMEEGHFMSNAEWSLPENSWKIDHKGYQEICVPMEKNPLKKAIQKVKINSIPKWAQAPFNGIESFNPVQSSVYQSAFLSSDNMLLCAPTGAGKTFIALLTMLREIGLHRDGNGTVDLTAFKIVYIAPMKSLVREMVGNFSHRLKEFGITVAELSGDQNLSAQQLHDTQVIVTTPEKWDVITRKGGASERWFTTMVRLVIFDEIHLLHDGRGPVLENLIARLLRRVEATQDFTRLVGLSATLPNYSDVATLLRVNPERGMFVFDHTFRPCPLQQTFIGITHKKAFRKHQVMNQICYDKALGQVKRGFQVLVFVHSRKETVNTAISLRDLAIASDEIPFFSDKEAGHLAIVSKEAKNIKDDSLRELMLHTRIGVHHAGLCREDRALVEDLFADGHLLVLCSTSTLAWGVNLPAHSVIIKGTQVYNPEKAAWTELSMLDVLQMLGRAGRFPHDTYGEGFIITSHVELKYYMSLLNEQLPVESQLLSRLPDSLNAEIVLGSIHNVAEAVDWMSYTYLYIRMLRSPGLYKVEFEEGDEELVQYRVDLIHTASILLSRAGLIKYDRVSGAIQPTELGRIASHYYLSYRSIMTYNENLSADISDIEIFRLFSMSEEFKYVSMRQQEKVELAKLMDQVPIPVKESIDDSTAKINVLLQAYISRLSLDGYSLISDMVFVTQSGVRLFRALFEIALSQGWAMTAQRILRICQSCERRMWQIESPLRQFGSLVPRDMVTRLEKMNFPWDNILDLTAVEVGELLRSASNGRKLHSWIHSVPRLEASAEVHPLTRSVLRVEITLTPDFIYDPSLHGPSVNFWVFIEDVNSETILHHELVVLKARFCEDPIIITTTVPVMEPVSPQYFIRAVADRWIESQSVFPLSISHLVLPDKFAPPTQLLDLQAQPLDECSRRGAHSQKVVERYSNEFQLFNGIQTQILPSVLDSESNVFVAAPVGAGIGVVIELALANTLDSTNGRCLLLVGLEPLAKYWASRLSRVFENVTLLVGDGLDSAKASKADIVVSSVDSWEKIHRRRPKKLLQSIAFVAVDAMELLGSDVGPGIEMTITRFMSAGKPDQRILGVSASVANAREIADWLRVPSKHAYNFSPSVRPLPLQISMSGFYQYDARARQSNMLKPASMAMADSSTVMYVSSRQQSRLVAVNILELCGDRFVRLLDEEMKTFTAGVSNKTLRETMTGGVAFLHEGLSPEDTELVTRLFDAGALSLLVVERKLVWGLPIRPVQVVILGTQYYEETEHRYEDYPISDVMRMVGSAQSRVLLYCHSARIPFYKRFVYDPAPVESHLNHYLTDYINAEVATEVLSSPQALVDYLSWTFYYRRLGRNPNYYGLPKATPLHISDHLSELSESVIEELVDAGCVELDEEEGLLSSLELGSIAAHYCLRFTTVQLFGSSLCETTRLQGLFDLLAAASEFETLSIRNGEERMMERLLRNARIPVPAYSEELQSVREGRRKVHVLLQAYLSRIPLKSVLLREDQKTIVVKSLTLLHSIVALATAREWLKPALAAMEFSQMLSQAIWDGDTQELFQLPHMTDEICRQFSSSGVGNLNDLLNLEDAEREPLFGVFSESQSSDIAHVCNSYPDIELSVKLSSSNVASEETLTAHVTLDCEEFESGAVLTPYYPGKRKQAWWLVIGDVATNKLYSCEDVSLKSSTQSVDLEFDAPETPGVHNLVVYLMSTCHAGLDDEFEVTLKVV